MAEQIVLFESKKDCCGCGACADICGTGAVSMKEDEYGFRYPVINKEKCVSCGKCKRVCGFRNLPETHTAEKVYAAMSCNDALSKKSASGGIFAELADWVLKQGGAVCGAAMEFEQGNPIVKHILIDSEDALERLQGSKYVQSNCDGVYGQVRARLNRNQKVLFSGTPCQVASLRRFLGKDAESENLYTVDIICHGVPSLKMFQDYMSCERAKVNGIPTEFKFRDKSIGWGMKGKLSYTDKRGKLKGKPIAVQLSSYYSHFMRADSYRESCYHCAFARPERAGDWTIGDYWQFGTEHPDQLLENSGCFSEEKGISCILVNTERGAELFEACKDRFVLCESSIDKIAKVNLQLVRPSRMSEMRSALLECYRNEGYAAVDRAYFKALGIKKYIYIMWNALPQGMRKKLKLLK